MPTQNKSAHPIKPPGVPACLSARARDIWWNIALDHAAAGETQRLNNPLITRYCQLAGDYLTARDHVRRQGLTCLSRRGNLRPSTAAQRLNRLFGQLVETGERLGRPDNHEIEE